MRAAVCHDHGPPEVLSIEDVPSPAAGPGQALVAVRAAAVNYPDVLFVADTYQVSVPTPFVPGSEFAGEVRALGPGVEQLAVGERVMGLAGIAVGDRVMGSAMVGAFAEEVVVDATSLRPVPATIELRDAAAFGVAHSTAFHVLRSFARIQPDEQLIVLGAGGGVGLAAVQLGTLLGARVTAVASSDRKLEVAAAAGALELVRHGEVDLRHALREVLPDGADAVVDPVGAALAEPALRTLRYGGRFVTVGFAGGEIPRIPLNLVLLKGCRILGFQMISFATHEPEAFSRNAAELQSLFGEGRIRPHIGASFPLDDTAEALRLVADGNAIGKVVIDIAG